MRQVGISSESLMEDAVCVCVTLEDTGSIIDCHQVKLQKLSNLSLFPVTMLLQIALVLVLITSPAFLLVSFNLDSF